MSWRDTYDNWKGRSDMDDINFDDPLEHELDEEPCDCDDCHLAREADRLTKAYFDHIDSQHDRGGDHYDSP